MPGCLAQRRLRVAPCVHTCGIWPPSQAPIEFVRCDWLRDGRAGFLGDLHRFDPAALCWVDITSSTHGNAPQPSKGHGFTAIAESLFLFGGFAAKGAGNELPLMTKNECSVPYLAFIPLPHAFLKFLLVTMSI